MKEGTLPEELKHTSTMAAALGVPFEGIMRGMLHEPPFAKAGD